MPSAQTPTITSAMPGGLSFGAVKDTLRLVAGNGKPVTSPTVMRQTNEAQNELLLATDPRTNAALVPVGTMATYNVVTDINGFFLLPPQLENALSWFVKPPGTGYGNADISQGWYDLVNPFTYVDPMAAHDNPLMDFGFVPDPDDQTVLRRQYKYPGITPGSIVTVTGKKRYRPITSDDDYLLIQNLPALKLMIQAIERRENFAPTELWKSLKSEAVQMLSDECVNALHDPRDAMRRKGDYELDLKNFPRNSFGWMRARLALEVPGAMSLGREELGRVMERAEMRLMEMVELFKGSLEEFDAKIVGGMILFPARVESVLMATICGTPVPIRSIFFKYQENGPGDFDCSCGGRLEDAGDMDIGGMTYRKYRYRGPRPSVLSAPSSASAPTPTPGTVADDGNLYIGTNLRLVPLANGGALEVKDPSGNWIRQSEWTE